MTKTLYIITKIIVFVSNNDKNKIISMLMFYGHFNQQSCVSSLKF